MKNLPANSKRTCRSRGFALVVTLIMVTLLAIIAIGLLTSTSLERATAKSYTDRYQAELAVKNGLQAAAKTLVASPTMATSATGQDTFLVVRADGAPDANGNKAAYYYLAQPSDIVQQTATTPGSSSITYYPLFSTDPTAPTPTPAPIDLTTAVAPTVPTPAPPANSAASDSTAAQLVSNGTIAKRFPTLYSWQSPASVKWVTMPDPQDTATAPAHNLPYTRYAYWAEDLDGYLDASQVGGQPRTSGTSPQEIAMFTIFAPTAQTDPGTTAATTLINDRSLLFTVPTLQQIAQTTPDVAGPNLAVRLGVDTAEQNLVPFGYAYYATATATPTLKPNLSTTLAMAQQGNGNASNTIGGAITSVLQGFNGRSITHQTRSKPGGGAPLTPVYDYAKNIGANIIDYVYPQGAPTDFMPKSQPYPTARGIGAYPFVTSVYDLNNWVSKYQINGEYAVVIEVKTYVQLWNPHNVPVNGILTLQYKNADQIQIFNSANPSGLPPQLLASPPAATIRLDDSDLNHRHMEPNEYRVVVLPTP
jgi:hypothetical protein